MPALRSIIVTRPAPLIPQNAADLKGAETISPVIHIKTKALLPSSPMSCCSSPQKKEELQMTVYSLSSPVNLIIAVPLLALLARSIVLAGTKPPRRRTSTRGDATPEEVHV